MSNGLFEAGHHVISIRPCLQLMHKNPSVWSCFHLHRAPSAKAPTHLSAQSPSHPLSIHLTPRTHTHTPPQRFIPTLPNAHNALLLSVPSDGLTQESRHQHQEDKGDVFEFMKLQLLLLAERRNNILDFLQHPDG